MFEYIVSTVLWRIPWPFDLWQVGLACIPISMCQLSMLRVEINGAVAFGSSGAFPLIFATVIALLLGGCCVFQRGNRPGRRGFVERGIQTEAENNADAHLHPPHGRASLLPPTVYTNDGGSRYHLPGCRHASGRARTPCLICCPRST